MSPFLQIILSPTTWCSTASAFSPPVGASIFPPEDASRLPTLNRFPPVFPGPYSNQPSFQAVYPFFFLFFKQLCFSRYFFIFFLRGVPPLLGSILLRPWSFLVIGFSNSPSVFVVFFYIQSHTPPFLLCRSIILAHNTQGRFLVLKRISRESTTLLRDSVPCCVLSANFLVTCVPMHRIIPREFLYYRLSEELFLCVIPFPPQL